MPLLSSPATRVLIAGGGIGGLATAVALQRRGIDSLVLEQAPRLTEVGSGLLLSPNAVHVLHRLGLGDAARARAQPIDEWRILDPRGRVLHTMRATHDGLSALSLHRADLQFLLQETLAPTALRLGFTVIGYEQNDLGVTVASESTGRERGPLLVGADGLRSRVRAGRFGAEAPRFCGYVGWRCVVPMVPRPYTAGWLSESWGEGKRFGITPLSGNRCYWYATANIAANSTAAAGPRRAELLRLFGHWHAPIPELIEAAPEETILLNDIFDRRARAPWTDGRVTLLGDAAHPMSPNLGQGACAALEDAWVLAREIACHGLTPRALQSYEHARWPRTTWIARASRALGTVIQLEHALAVGVRDAGLRVSPSLASRLVMRPLFAFRP